MNGFKEKIDGDGSWINGGFFVLEPSTLNLIKDDETIWENEPLNYLAQNQQLTYFKHTGFWQPMDTLREKIILRNYGDKISSMEKLVMVENSFWKDKRSIDNWTYRI